MAEERVKRKLTAIVSADVKGYSRLMGEDEISTIQTLKKYRDVMASLVQEYEGRVIDSPGDNILAEFGSVVDAVECAVKIQGELKERNSQLPDDRRMEFRIGVNLGDVIDDEGRIYGDGVNVTSRVEGLAEGGGICISGTAFDQIPRIFFVLLATAIEHPFHLKGFLVGGRKESGKRTTPTLCLVNLSV